jgi:hypothetical protein
MKRLVPIDIQRLLPLAMWASFSCLGAIDDGSLVRGSLDGRRIKSRALPGVVAPSGHADVFLGANDGKFEFFAGAMEEIGLHSRAHPDVGISRLDDAGPGDRRSDSEKAGQNDSETTLKIAKEKENAAMRKVALEKWNDSVRRRQLQAVDLETMARNSMRHYMTKNTVPLAAYTFVYRGNYVVRMSGGEPYMRTFP